MISMLFGLPGSGKTLTLSYAVKRALKNPYRANTRTFQFMNHCLDDRNYNGEIKVYTNFPMENCYKLNFQDLGKKNFHHCLIVIDEIQLLADSRDYKNFGDNLVWFFTMARHKYCDCLLATQSFDTCDRKIRLVTDRLYYIDSWLFNCIRLRQIITRFSVDKDIAMKYDFVSGFNTKYLYKPRLYKLCDSYADISDRKLLNEPLEKWNFEAETAAAATKTAAENETEKTDEKKAV